MPPSFIFTFISIKKKKKGCYFYTASALVVTDERPSSLHQVFKGLAYLHKKEIVHRDVKVSNLLLTNMGTIKIGGSFVRLLHIP